MRRLVALGISANVLTLGGFFLNATAGLLVALGALPPAGLLYLLSCSLDFLDGAVARLSGTSHPRIFCKDASTPATPPSASLPIVVQFECAAPAPMGRLNRPICHAGSALSR